MLKSPLISYTLLTISSLITALPPSATSTHQPPISLAHFTSPTDQPHITHLLSAYNDALTLLTTIISTTAWDSPTYDLYFPPSSRHNISLVFQKILSGASTQVTIDNNDRPWAGDAGHRGACEVVHGVAFTHNEPTMGRGGK
ncbi:MAG: hypothetical protein Q9186_006280, partial [Xanthomendoza sp. 1 TL-2023]